MKNINVTDLSEVTEFLDKKFSLMENQNKKSEIEESPVVDKLANAVWCGDCDGLGRSYDCYDEEQECERCGGTGHGKLCRCTYCI